MNCRDKRIKWIDVAKFIGIFAIYLGHFGSKAGYAYQYVFSFHVALFFFLAGNVDAKKDVNIIVVFKKKLINVLIPFYTFAIISIILKTIVDNSPFMEIKADLTTVLKGVIRNDFFAGSLWFLTALFIVSILFSVVKLIKYKSLIIFIFIILHIYSKKFPEPCLAYNLDSACYYGIFYALGFLSFNRINFLLNSEKKRDRIMVFLSASVALTYSAGMFLGKDMLSSFWGMNVFVNTVSSILKPLVIIWSVIIIAYILQDTSCFNEIGKNTLYLCGCEWIIKTCVPILFSIVGLSIQIQNPMAAYIYTFALLWIANKFIVPIEKNIIIRIQRFLNNVLKI